MITILANIFIKNENDTTGEKKRQAYGILCGSVGICLNIFLFLGKFLAGTVSNSISITADAFNNLSDAGSSFVTLVGFKLAGAKPDIGHPFGHGRLEYISGLVVSGAIIIMAFELVKGSVEKIIHPQAVTYNTLALAILAVSICVKLYMFTYNRSIGRKMDSAAMRATAMDSLSDCIATTVVLLAAIVGKFTQLQIDGFCGVLVGLFIFYAGVNAARETMNPLLGQSPDPAFVKEIEALVMSHKEVCGIHDLIVHDYGPGRRMISLHAEVPAKGDILTLHDAIDNIEGELRRELHCDAVIHMDPIVTTDKHILHLKEKVRTIVRDIDPSLTIHDFRAVAGPTHINLIFDVVIPFRFRLEDEALIHTIQKQVWEQVGSNHFCVIQVDKAYVPNKGKA